MLRTLHDSDYYGGIINTDIMNKIMNKEKLSEASWSLQVKNEENNCKQQLYLVPPKGIYMQVMG